MIVAGAWRRREQTLEGILAEVDEYMGEGDRFIQLFDPTMVIGKEHLLWAYDKAKYCFDEGENRADSLKIETLLWASGERQIKDALKKIGLNDDLSTAAVMIEDGVDIFFDFMDWKRDDSLLEPSIEKLKRYGVTEKEISTVDDPYEIVFERMALSTL